MKTLYQNLPETPGVYIFKDSVGKILYIGKAGNLKRRVSSYFLRPHDSRIEKLVSKIRKIDYKKTGSALEALILESQLIKKHAPPWNVREKDDTSFLYVEITKDQFPRVLLARGKSKSKSYEARPHKHKLFGPFVSASSIREALRILRRIFPWNLHASEKIGKFSRPCFDYEIGLCPGTCIGAISREDYLTDMKRLELIFRGGKIRLLSNLKKEMELASKKLQFEKAEKLRKQIFALRHIQDVALISDSEIRNSKPRTGTSGSVRGRLEIRNSAKRIEGYDVSNISGAAAVGSMVVAISGEPARNEYRKFKIRTIKKSDDVGMLKEILRRRFCHKDWSLPDLILIDGGKGQVNAAKSVLSEFGLKLPIAGIAKGAKRKKNEFIGEIPGWTNARVLIRIRDEAHRFAVSYHQTLRRRRTFQ